MDNFIYASSFNVLRFSSGAGGLDYNFINPNNSHINILDDVEKHENKSNMEVILNTNFFDIFKHFNKTKENIKQTLSYYHSSGIKVYIHYKFGIISNCPHVCIQLEGSEYNSIFIDLDESDIITDVSEINSHTAEVAIHILKNIEGIHLLAIALGINTDINPFHFLNKIEKIKCAKIPILKDMSIMSNQSIIIGKHIFDILKCVTLQKTRYSSFHSICVIYKPPDGITSPMVNFMVCDRTSISIVLDDANNVETIDILNFFKNPFEAEFILNSLKDIEGIPLIAEAIGIKMDYTQDELLKMKNNFGW